MNAIDHPNIFMRSLATRDAGSEISQALPDVIAACKVAGFDLIVVETSGIGQGDAAIVPLVDSHAVRDDARVRRRQPAREDRHARLRRLRRDQQVRPQGRAGRAARRRQAVPAQPRAVRPAARTRCRCSAPRPRASTTTASPRSTRACCRGWSSWACASIRPPAGCRRSAARHSSSQVVIVPPGRVRYLADIADTRARLQGARPRAEPAGARDPAAARSRSACFGEAAPDERPRRRARSRSRRQVREARLDPAAAQAARRCGPDMQKAYARRRVRGEDPRQGDPHRADPHLAVGHARSARWRCRAYEDHGELLKWLLLENVPGCVPVHRRRVRVQARGRRPDAHVRRRRRSVPHQPPLQAALRGHAGQAPVDRVRLGDALRPRPRPAPRHLRQGRQLGRVDRHARRHEGAVRGLRPVRPGDQRVDDDQRPGADASSRCS